jgi:hypothetical protein
MAGFIPNMYSPQVAYRARFTLFRTGTARMSLLSNKGWHRDTSAITPLDPVSAMYG